MAPRKREQNEQMRAETLEKIKWAAMHVFAENGYHGTTMKQISAATGLSYGLVYHYYPSKEELFRNLVDMSLDASIGTIVPALEISGSAWEKLENLCKVMVEVSFRGEAALYFIIALQAMTQGRNIPGLMEHIQKRSSKHYETIIPIIAEAQASGQAATGNPATIAASFFAYVQGLTLLIFMQPEMEGQFTTGMLLNVLRKHT